MPRPALLGLCIAWLVASACSEQSTLDGEEDFTAVSDLGGDTEADAATDTDTEDAGPGDTAPADVPNDTAAPLDVPDTDDTATLDDTAPSDADAVADADAPEMTGDPCLPPQTISPRTVDSAGYDTVILSGGEFYIGALEHWLILDDTIWVPVDYMQIGEPLGLCQLPFKLPPLAPGTYSVTSLYSWPPSPEIGAAVGTLTVEAATAPWHGATGCTSSSECDAGTACHAGTGFCVPTACPSHSIYCGEPEATVCDPLEGCQPRRSCASDSDCALLFTSCGCVATHVDDPRAAMSSLLDDCELGGCETCVTNRCAQGGVAPICDPETELCTLPAL